MLAGFAGCGSGLADLGHGLWQVLYEQLPEGIIRPEKVEQFFRIGGCEGLFLCSHCGVAIAGLERDWSGAFEPETMLAVCGRIS